MTSQQRGGEPMITNRNSASVRAHNLRRTNLAVVLDRVRRHGPSSRSQLVDSTGLTRSSIGGLVEELVSLELATEVIPAPDGSPGRPSPVAQVDTAHVGVLAVDIGVDGVGVAVVALDGTVIQSVRLVRSQDRVPMVETVNEVVALARNWEDRIFDELRVVTDEPVARRLSETWTPLSSAYRSTTPRPPPGRS